MSPLIENAMRAIENGDSVVANEGFLILAEVVAVNRLQNFRSDIVPEANGEILEWASLEKIQHFVQHWIEAHPDHPSVTSAFWVLGKFHDKALRPFLRTYLERYVRMIEPHLAPIGQILVDLETLGDDSLSNGSFSAGNHGKNLDDALNYLKKTSTTA